MNQKTYTATATLIAILIYLITTASLCSPNLTPSQNLANIAANIEQTADQMVLAVDALNKSNPTVVTDKIDVAVALAGDKVGRAGADLSNTLMAYSNLKNAGGDTAAQVLQIQNLISSITQAFSDMGKTIPNGTIVSIDQSVTTILGMVAQIKAGTGL